MRAQRGVDVAGACVQISAHHYSYAMVTDDAYMYDVLEAAAKEPLKHGFISSADQRHLEAFASAAQQVPAARPGVEDASRAPT